MTGSDAARRVLVPVPGSVVGRDAAGSVAGRDDRPTVVVFPHAGAARGSTRRGRASRRPRELLVQRVQRVPPMQWMQRMQRMQWMPRRRGSSA
ncbi:hypothetical protein CXF40_05500 [Corynebacterium bovis]|uniref:Uncharacterized protein n=1 Tax=Corynebacterium bovis TaxID=36808 RepID=A0A3R8R4E4_9CORY|nr:hypothetical protein [Corynebacterium bovis]RRO91824.1 hypothetical protein CXF40_05500 [Corynebacterium bovis]RRO99994.1 hypothetical protein CXF41_08070 [Corynebacterium bovis]RRQ02958.1 hypothetical protein CXF42_08645 [Corynebacterium bovis]